MKDVVDFAVAVDSGEDAVDYAAEEEEE